MFKFASAKSKRRGFTLTELAIAAGIIGAIIAAVWAGAVLVIENQKTTRATQQILEIVTNVRDIMAMRPVFKTNATNYVQSLYQAKAFPGDMTLNSDANGYYVANPWNGRTIVFSDELGLSYQTFRVSYYGITSSICTKIASAIISQSGTPSADPVQITAHYGGYTKNLTSTAVDGASIANICGNNTTSEAATNSVEFDFRVSR